MVIVIFQSPGSLCSSLGGIDPEKPYQAFFPFLPPLLLFFGRDGAGGVITRLHFIGKSGKAPQDHEIVFNEMYMDTET